MQVIEWAEFQLKEGVSITQCLEASSHMQTNFLDDQPGFVHRSTVQLDQHTFADVVTWASQADADNAMQTAVAYPSCVKYFSLLQVDSKPRIAQSIWQSAPRQAPLQGVEFSHFQLKADADPAKLKRAAQRMADAIYRHQSGFIHHQVLAKEGGWYADVLFATSAKRARELCNLWHEQNNQAACQDYLDLIEPSSIQLAFWQDQ
jgi:hypothetical protein